MVVIVTLKFHDAGLSSDARTEIKTYDQVICLDVNAETGFLTIETAAGAFTFDPKIWKGFVVDIDNKPK